MIRTALGRALYRVPQRVRNVLPASVRNRVRRRSGPFAPWEAGFDRAAPPPRSGETVGPPDFVGIGVQKAGTTWWFSLLVEHPSVFHRDAIHKERHYFAPFATEPFGPDEVRAYHAWFPRTDGTITGEWTPDYASQAWVPPLLAMAAPSTKLLMIVRDPVERLLSGVAHSEVHHTSHAGIEATEAVDRGFYATAVRRWQAHFGAEQLLVLQYEQCTADPAVQLGRTYRFLGLDPAFRPVDLRRRHSPTTDPKITLDDATRHRLAELYTDDVTQLAALVPDLDVGLWPNFAHR